jgi:hypothetical protein
MIRSTYGRAYDRRRDDQLELSKGGESKQHGEGKSILTSSSFMKLFASIAMSRSFLTG